MTDFSAPDERRYDPRDPDNALVALFKHHAIENIAKSKEAGRPIFDDVEYVEIRAWLKTSDFPGNGDIGGRHPH
jgi:hypothetical protein